MIKKIVITAGDSDGIGAEVIGKALRRLGPQKNIQFIIYYQNKIQEKYFRGLKTAFTKSHLSFCRQSSSPALWIEELVHLQIQKKIDGLVTGPLSKPEIKKAGLDDLGHTDIIRRASGSKSAYMCFLGGKFNVALVTGHLPITKISEHVTSEKIVELGEFVHQIVQKSFKKLAHLPIGILGLNPHAGDSGLIGHDEDRIKSAIGVLRQRGIFVEGPLIPDACFQSTEWKKYSFYLAMYHDQGLIPFKLAHGRSGSHLTLGVPITRTSVDHGTANDIFDINKADSQSMLDAIRLCVKLVRSRNV